jgi:uncharacterized surface protein with fasciclin (FAS1) repeats
MPFAVTAAVVGDENATVTPGDETGQAGNQTENMTIAAYIAQDQNLTRLNEAINAAGLFDTLNSGGPYTIFAPNDEAFNALGNDTFNQLMTETDNLTMLLQYHVVSEEYTAENLTNMTQTQNQTGNQTENETDGDILGIIGGLLGGDEGEQAGNMTMLETLSGESLNVTASDGEVMIENATVVQADIMTSNGVIHIVDQVLLPPDLNLTTTENVTAAGMETVTPAGVETVTPAGIETVTPAGMETITPALTGNLT